MSVVVCLINILVWLVICRVHHHYGWRIGVIRAYCALDMKDSAAMRDRYAKEWKVIDQFEADVIAHMLADDHTASPSKDA